MLHCLMKERKCKNYYVLYIYLNYFRVDLTLVVSNRKLPILQEQPFRSDEQPSTSQQKGAQKHASTYK